MRVLRVLLIGFIMCTSAQLLAWGQTGHRVIGEIAENHLSRKAKRAVQKLLGDESLAMVSTWMDEIRSEDAYNHTHSWHFTTIPPGETYKHTETEKDGHLVQAIQNMVATLQNDEASSDEQQKALKMLVHLIGDLHQPLHVGTGQDRGGNELKLEFFFEKSNLHRIWDSGIIDHKQLSYTELAEALDHAPKDQIMKWLQATVIDWANEAPQYRDQIYNIGDKEYVGYGYVYRNWGLVQQQLLKAGIRLAGLLNAIYG